MGDHRASIQIQFEMHGIEKKIDMWINWYDNGFGIDDRIVDFFRESSHEAINKYEKKIWENNKVEREKKLLEEQKILYEELKKKLFPTQAGMNREKDEMKLDLVETECSCDDCKAMCRVSCVGTPKEMQKIIDAGFGKRLCFDDLPGGSTLIKPALKGDEGKRSRWETRSEEGCTFWINGKCELHNLKLKPLGGKIAHHDQTDENYEKLHDFLEKSWHKKQAKTIINNWKKINLYKD